VRRERRYSDYRTRIRNGMRQGPTFAGHMALIEIGCGTSCVVVYAGDVTNGRVFDFPLGGEDNPSLGLRYDVRSRALVAYWVDGNQCIRETFVWRDSTFTRLEGAGVGDQDLCYSLATGEEWSNQSATAASEGPKGVSPPLPPPIDLRVCASDRYRLRPSGHLRRYNVRAEG
jgi:hypothetical protein